jgi:hypothetical protein
MHDAIDMDDDAMEWVPVRDHAAMMRVVDLCADATYSGGHDRDLDQCADHRTHGPSL